jgi:hypothetical protein
LHRPGGDGQVNFLIHNIYFVANSFICAIHNDGCIGTVLIDKRSAFQKASAADCTDSFRPWFNKLGKMTNIVIRGRID